MSKINIQVINGGEAMEGSREGVWRIDSHLPLIRTNGISNGEAHMPPFRFDLDWYIREQFGIQGVTYKDLVDFIRRGKYAHLLEVAVKHLQEISPNEIAQDHQLYGYVPNTGCGQLLHFGVIKILAALTAGMDRDIIGNLVRQGTELVILFGGLTGGTGAAMLLVLPRFLQESGFASVVPIGALTHVPSIQVRGIVEEHTVIRVRQMLQLIPNLVIFTGLPAGDDEGHNTWTDIQELSPRVAELFSNAEKLAEVHGIASNLWLLGVNLVHTLIDRWEARVLAETAGLTTAEASRILNKYIQSGHLAFGSPDANGYQPVVSRSAELLQLQHLRELFPALLYLKHNVLRVEGTRERRGLFGTRAETYEVDLHGSPLVDRLLEKAGAKNVGDIRKNGFAGMAGYEEWLLQHAEEKTAADAMAYWVQNWVELARIYMGAAFGENLTFEPVEHLPADTRFYGLAQPKFTAHELAVRALSILGDVQDPDDRIAAERAREQAAAARAAQERSVEEEISARLNKGE